jgi:hypothetical protein
MSRAVAALLVVVCVALGCGRIGFTPSVTREALVVNATQVAADLSEFPVLVSLDDPELAAHCKVRWQ